MFSLTYTLARQPRKERRLYRAEGWLQVDTEVPLTGLKAVRQCGGAAGTCPAPPAVPASPGATVATGEADGSAERRVVLPKSAAGGEEKRG